MSGCITSKYPINHSNSTMKKYEKPGLQQHLHQCRHLCRSIHHTGAGGQGQCRHQKAGETCLVGGPSWVKSMRFGEDNCNNNHPIKNFWLLVNVTLKKFNLFQNQTTLNAESQFSPGEIVAKGHSHPWAIPWFCTPMVYPPQALRGHRSRSGLLKRQWIGGLPENAFIFPLPFDPQKKTLRSTLLSRAFAYRLSNWTPMDGGRFQWPALYGFKQLPLTWSHPWQNTFLYAPCTWSLSKTTSVTGGWS